MSVTLGDFVCAPSFFQQECYENSYENNRNPYDGQASHDYEQPYPPLPFPSWLHVHKQGTEFEKTSQEEFVSDVQQK